MMPQFLGTNAVGWILTALVLLLLFLVGAILKRPVLLLRTGLRTTGVVVGWKSDETDDAVRAPIAEFVTESGVHVRVTGALVPRCCRSKQREQFNTENVQCPYPRPS